MSGKVVLRRFAWIPLLIAGGCSASITFNAALEDVNVNFRSGLPDDATIESVPCATQSICDAISGEIDFTCTDGVCDPDPIVVAQTLAEVDFASLSSGVLSALDSVQLKRVAYDFSQNTLPVDVGPVEIFWGPAGAANVDSTGVMRLGTFPGVPASTTPEGDMVLDPVGNDALSDYIKSTSQNVRFFARGSVDLEPGDDIPQSVVVEARFVLTIKATGDIR